MNKFPFLSQHRSLIGLRVALGLYMVAHAVARLSAGIVGNFGDFLGSKGFPFGLVLAWGITVFELVGGTSLALGFFRRTICAVFSLQLLMGILLVHRANGWFVVGSGTGGMEYSVLLILSFLVVAADRE